MRDWPHPCLCLPLRARERRVVRMQEVKNERVRPENKGAK